MPPDNNIIDLASAKAKRDPHLSGRAICLSCRNEWVAVAPVGSVWLDCPECGLQRGRFMAQCEVETKHWFCNCGNDLFHATPEGFYCPNCGTWHTFP